MKKILLSIGIIFKNEIRCLERCLKSLQPLRDAIPCEVVMADTGADDGSRKIAEKYADILIDFPWINDFSAARNAVMDRSSGEWFMTIDCDEWVDKNIEGFVAFLTGKYDFDFASVIIRNYDTLKLDEGGSYSDFLATRLLRMSTGLRYEGSIHEHWHYKGDLRTMMIRGAVFHHDGYVYQDKEKWRKKQARNMEPLRQQLEKDPENLVILNQCVESSAEMPEQEGYLRRALAGTDEKWSQWELFGPSIYRYAVRMALRDSLPELEDWIRKAEEMFPNSIFTRVEVAYFAFGHYWNTDDYPQALHWGEKYLQGVEDYHAGRFNRADLLASSLDKTDTHSRLSVATVLASGYLHEEQPEKCVQLMEKLDPAQMNAKQIMDCVRNFGQLRHAFRWDTDRQIGVFWERLSEPVPDRKQAQERQTAFLQAGAAMFTREYRETEAFAYSVFLPLEGVCPLGIAAAILQTVSPEKLETQLGRIEHWDEVPVQALMHALEQGAAFPLPDKPLDMETMAGLAARLAQDQQRFLPLALRLAERRERPELVWLQLLLAAAVRSYPWGGKEQEEAAGMTLARAFARMEQEFLPLYYAEDTLREERLFTLPALHRLGWYCVRAFDALDAGDTAGYVRLLREGLNACEGMKPLVEFLMDHTPELQKPAAPSAELLALAEQVRTILAQFPPDDPAVMALKQSEAYRQVAYLIEEEAPPVRTKRVLMAAYFFPPLSGSGVFRSLKFAKYLPEFGWQPTVISTDQPPSGWKFEDQSQVSEIPKDMEVVRIPDEISTGRNMTIAGERVQELLDFLRSVVRYSPEADRIFAQMAQSKEGTAQLLTFPCASLSWAYDVVQYIEKNINLKQFQAVYTTSGPASAHLIGFYLKQKYGISWVADYRDPWTFNAYGAEYDPQNTYHKFLYELESVLLHQADCNLTIADDMIPSYQQNFHLPPEQIASITNGYDEADFSDLPLPARRIEKFTINYSGVLYTDQERIEPILEALRQLGREGKMELSQVRFRIVGVGVEEYGAVARPYGLEHILVQTGYLSHRDALLSNLNADLLLLLVGDGAKFRHVFTGKFFDYLRSGRPILALAPKDGAVDRVLRESGHGETYLSTEIPKIKAMILKEYRKWKCGEVPKLLHSPVIERFERKTLTRQLADVLDGVTQSRASQMGTIWDDPAKRVIIHSDSDRTDDARLSELADLFLDRNYNYVWLKAMLQKASERSAKNAVLITGSSYGVNGIIENVWNHAINCSASSQDLYYDFLCAQKVLPAAAKDQFSRGFIVDGYYAACHDLSLGIQERQVTIPNVYYPIYKDGHNWNGAYSNDLWSGLGHLTDEEKLRCEQLAIEKLSKQGTYFSNGKQRGGTVFDLKGREWQNVPADERQALGKVRAESHNKLFQHTDTLAENRRILKEYVHLLHLNGVMPVFLIAPFAAEYIQFISKEMKESVSAIIADVSEDIRFVDFNQFSCFSPADFVDTDHLSRKGAEKFSRMLTECFGR